MFLVDIKFQRPEDISAELTQAHRDYLQPLYDEQILLFGGRKVPRTGGIILAHGIERARLESLMDKDPLIAEGYATYTMIEFQTVMASLEFRALLTPAPFTS